MKHKAEALQGIIDNCDKTGKEYPKFIQDAPKLIEGLQIFYDAFVACSTCRGGMGDGPIPWTVIEQYADRLKADDGLRDLLHYHIRGMDNVALTKASKGKGDTDGDKS